MIDRSRTVYELFRTTCAERSSDPAVEVASTRHTFAELARAAGWIARRAQRAGLREGALVGLLLPRDLRLPAGVFAAIGLGATFVPLTDKYPRERIASLAAAHGVEHFITSEELVGLLPAGSRPILVPAAGLSDEPWPARPAAGAPLYVIFTSGSTGVPKGVLIREASVGNLIDWTAGRYAPEERRSVLASTPITFDLSIFEIVCTLCLGGKIVLVESVLDLLSCADDLDVTLINTVPSAAKELVRFKRFPPATRVVNLAGEALHQDLVTSIYETSAAEKVYNLYGPSEDTTYSTWYLAGRTSPEAAVRIGRPLPGKQAHVLDEALEPVADGDSGEICLSGEGLASGYLGDPDLTAKKFVTIERGSLRGLRVYRTGDLGRRDDRGELCYLGRIDRQVKIRGVRIEPGELEVALRSLPGVVDAAAVKVTDATGNDHLLAFAVAADPSVQPEPLREALRARVPEFLVPSRIELVCALPLNAHRKVDHAELEARGRRLFGAGGGGPSRDVVNRLCALVSSLLGVQGVDESSNFFKLGGNSLLSAQLAFRIGQELAVSLTIADVFRCKTIGSLAALIDKDRPGSGAGAGAGGGATSAPGRPASPARAVRPAAEKIPATPMQRGIWLLEQTPQGRSVSNVVLVFEYTGELDGALLDACLKQMIEAHPILKTTYVKDGDALFLKVKPYNSFHLRAIDLDGLPAEAQRDAVDELLGEETTKSFDLGRDLMLRATNLRLGGEGGLLAFVFHHIAVDDRSLSLFFTELADLYRAGGRAREAARRSYLDYCAEEAGPEAQEDRGANAAYWIDQLRGFERGTGYPSPRPAPRDKTFVGAHLYHPLDAELGDQLDAGAAARSTTPFVLLASAVTHLLHAATGEADVCIGTFVSSRDHFTDRDTLGFFVNTLPLRTRVHERASPGDLLEAVAASIVDLQANRRAAIEDVFDRLALGADARKDAFRVMVNLEPELVEELSLGQVRLRKRPLDRGIAKYDLLFSLKKERGGYRLLVEYSTALYTPDEVHRICGNVEAALDALLADERRPLSEIFLAPRPTRDRVPSVLGWRREGSLRAEPLDRLVLAARAGDEAHPAIVTPERTMSYGELARRSAAVARALRDRGVGAGEVVGVCEQRTPETIAALVGVLRAGAAYTGIDPRLPQARLRAMADACGARFVLGHRRALDPLAPSGLVGIDLDEACRAAEGPPIEAPADPERLAYVCFTSGTTGEPKAVGVPHRCAMRIVRGSRYADLSARDVFLHASPLAFDASVLEVWGALCNGATLALAPDGAFALEELAACIARHGVTVLWLTAPLFNEMVDRKAGALAGVSQLLVGGDRVSPAHVRRLIEGGYRGRLIDGYGPTETTVFATSHLVDGAHLERYAEDIPIGRALGDTSVVVLNARRGLAPCGVAGEIAIGGAGVARGYLNDTALTAERFRELRLAGLPDARFYLTGDLGLIGDDGELRYVGRRDRQVKVSGYRIELDAVEAALARAPGVTGCHCVADGGLVAYVARGPGPGAEQAIRDHARAHLPPYMVPSRFVFVDALPLNKNGKLDPSRLPRTDAGGEVAAPRAASLAPDLSELVRDVWRKELSNAAFGDDDNFFDIGGSSLKIMSVHEELCRALEPHGAAAKLEIMHLFEHTTVTALSSFLKGLVGDDDRG